MSPTLLENGNWSKFANCIGIDPEVFFPEGSVDKTVRKVCSRCPVQQLCLAEGLVDSHNTYGVWGGLARKERKRMASGNNPA